MASDEEIEAEFVRRLKARDERAFNELVLTYERRIFRLAFRMLNRRDEAEDIAQDVFVQVFKGIGSFRGDSKLLTWIYKIALNLCKNRLVYLGRRRLRNQADADDLGDHNAFTAAKGVIVGETTRPDEMLEGTRMEAMVKRALAMVDPDYREALVLCDLEDLSYEEIGEITGIPSGTVKSRIHRGRAQLRTLIEEAVREKARKGK